MQRLSELMEPNKHFKLVSIWWNFVGIFYFYLNSKCCFRVIRRNEFWSAAWRGPPWCAEDVLRHPEDQKSTENKPDVEFVIKLKHFYKNPLKTAHINL